jgi:hypothetical protein
VLVTGKEVNCLSVPQNQQNFLRKEVRQSGTAYCILVAIVIFPAKFTLIRSLIASSNVLALFRTNQLFSSVFLIFYILLLRFSVVIAPFKWAPSGHGIFSEILFNWVGSQQLFSHVIAVLLLLVQAFLVNMLSINHRLSSEVNLFPGLFFILISCALPDFLYLSPVLIGNTFFLAALLELYGTYKNPACADNIFNAGIWIGVASLFYFPFLFLFVLVMAALNILRAFNIREQLMIVIGIFMPYFLTALYYFWFDRLDVFWNQQFGRNASFFSLGGIAWNWESFLKLSLFLLLLVWVVFNSNIFLIKKNIQVQKKINILFWALAAAGFASIFQNNLTFEHLLMLAPPLGIFLGLTFTSMKPQWAESLHFLMVVGVLALQFTSWLV